MIHVGSDISFKDFAPPDHTALNWHEVCLDIKDALDGHPPVVMPYEIIRELGASQYYRIFLKSLGVHDPSTYRIDRASLDGRKTNRSYSALAIEIARRVNPLLNEKEKKSLRVFLQNKFSTATHDRARLLSPAETDEIIARCRPHNELLFAEFIPDEFARNTYGYF